MLDSAVITPVIVQPVNPGLVSKEEGVSAVEKSFALKLMLMDSGVLGRVGTA